MAARKKSGVAGKAIGTATGAGVGYALAGTGAAGLCFSGMAISTVVPVFIPVALVGLLIGNLFD